MAFKINIAHKGKTFKVETEDEILIGKSIGDTIKGEEVSPDFAGYELEITGTSDKAGFPGLPELQGSQLKKELLTYGRGMKQRPRREGKFKTPNTQGLRLRKTVRGKEISQATVQINIKVIKEGSKKFDDFFKTEEAPSETATEEKPTEEPKPAETPKEEKTSEQSLPNEPKAEEAKSEEKPAEEKKEEATPAEEKKE